MRTLEECKADIRLLTARDREQLVLWLAKGMPAPGDEASAEANDPIANILAMELAELLGHRSSLERSGGPGEDIYRLNERIAVKHQEIQARRTPAAPDQAGATPPTREGEKRKRE
jgi:hypothetical protein